MLSNSVSISITDWSIYDAGDSPECTLPVKNTTGFSLSLAYCEQMVIISIGHCSKLSPIF
jgi:hypothetical protein